MIIFNINYLKRNFIPLLVMLFAVCGDLGAQLSYDKNFVATVEVKLPGIITTSSINNLQPQQRVVKVEYIDGLGRSEQKIMVNATELGVDMVAPTEYDALGRPEKQYLPYAKTATGAAGSYSPSWKTEQLAFYQNNNPAILPNDLPDNKPFSITKYEASPMNRPASVFAPGNAWAGTEGTGSAEVKVKSDYKIYNTATDLVKTWEYNNSAASSIPVIATAYTYLTGDLSKLISTDEQGRKTEEYKDKTGNTILKKVQLANSPGGTDPHEGWLCTYFIYDNLNQLRFVLPPKATEWLRNNGWTLNQSIIDELCFWYEYDNRGRMISKHVPGAKPVNMVYDQRDRLVFTQDGNMVNQRVWMTTIYDFLNRPIATLFWGSTASRATLQGMVDADASPVSETVSLLGDDFSISLKPTFINLGITDLLTLSYYDKYPTVALSGNPLGFDPNYNLPYSPGSTTATGDYPEDVVVNGLNVLGLVTVTKVKTLDPTGTAPQYLGSSNWYDRRYRVIQNIKENIMLGKDIITTQYDFTGKILGTYQSNTPHNVTVITKNELTIDGKLARLYKGVNSSTASKLVATTTYDKIGRTRIKATGEGTICESKQDYTYNIRGWVRGVNLNYLNGQILPTNQRYFGYELAYNVMSPAIAGTFASFPNPQLNGNIGSIIWASAGKAGRDAQGIWIPSTSGIMRKYDYTYDNTNRLKKADFSEYKQSIWLNSEKDFSVSGNDNGIRYDENGNILSMNQMGVDGASIDQIDVLSYSYLNNGNSNKLNAVSDASVMHGSFSQLGDFHENMNWSGNADNDYFYDDNGNLTNDVNKKIQQIIYNHLNMPQQIYVHRAPVYPGQNPTKGEISYIYDALGNKLKKVVTEYPEMYGEPAVVTSTSYCGGFTYLNSELTQIAYEEGRIRWAMQPGGNREYKFDWMIKDHLGNIRMVLTEEPNPSTQKQYLATFESEPTQSVPKEQIAMEKALFGEEVLQPVRNNLPEELKDKDAGNRKAALLRPGATKVPYKIVKAAAGDKFSIAVQYFYKKQSSKNNSKSVREDILKQLLTNIISLGTGNNSAAAHGNEIFQVPGTAPGISPDNLRVYTSSGQDERGQSNKPKAYLNYLLLDTAMQFVKGGALRVGDATDDWQTLAQTDIEATRPGYFLVYVSNESQPTPDLKAGNVYFDNLRLVTNEGPVMEENHYYPFGLLMDAISSTGTGKLENKLKYNGYQFNSDLDINLYETFYRSHDPQIGRFSQIDPKPNHDISLYTAMNNNPVSIMDPLGDTTIVNATRNNIFFTNKGDLISGVDFVNRIISEWEYIGALDLNFNQTTGQIEFIGFSRSSVFSETGRQEILNMVRGNGIVTYDLVQNGITTGADEIDLNLVHFNVPELMAIREGTSSDLDSRTLGPGMVGIHEWRHTLSAARIYGGQNASRVVHTFRTMGTFGVIDNIDILGNKIRSEMSAKSGYNWGQRLSYRPELILGKKYLPFSTESLNALQQNYSKVGGFYSGTFPLTNVISW